MDLRANMPEFFNECQKMDDESKENFFRIFDLGVNQGYVKPHIDNEILFLIHYNTIHNILQPEIMINLSLNSEEVLNMIYEVLFMGVLEDKGKKKIKIFKHNQGS
jgi:hypothetical protein